MIFILILTIFVVIGTWIIKICFRDAKSALVIWLFFAAGAPFATSILWITISTYMSPDIASDIVEDYITAVTTPIMNNIPMVLITIFVALSIAITLIALTGKDNHSPIR